MPFDAALLDKSLAAKIVNVALHPRTVSSITQPREVVRRNDAKLAQADERSDFRLAERIFTISLAINGTILVVAATSTKRRWPSLPDSF